MRILLVAMPNSIHTIRWVSQFADKNWEIYLFPSISARIHEKGTEIFKPKTSFLYSCKKEGKRELVSLFPNFLLGQIIQRVVNKSCSLLKLNWREIWLKRTIKAIKPDIIHSLEFQSGAYLTCSVKHRMKAPFPTWITTNWGCDIQIYSQIDTHYPKIIDVLQEADFYSAECARDYIMAEKLGFKGRQLPVIPNAGGLNLEKALFMRMKNPVEERNLILIKGYQGMFGRAIDALKMLELAAPHLPENTEIFIYSATHEVALAADLLKKKIKLNICYRMINDNTSHEEMLELFSKAKVYIGVSIADGISTSLLEAMAYGAIPIQTNTACADEWLEHGKTGFIIEPNQIEKNANFLIQAVTDNNLATQAFHKNWETITRKAKYEFVANISASFYETAYAHKDSTKNITG